MDKVVKREVVICKHDFVRISNNWFHWNTGEVMTLGRCLKCGVQEEIEFSIIKREVILKKRASKVFSNPKDALEAFNELVELKKERPPMWGKTYWNNSVDAMDLSPEQ